MMSNYGREHGTLHFTKTGYAQFVRLFRQKHNELMAEVYRHTMSLHAKLSTIKGGDACTQQRQAFDDTLGLGGFVTGHRRLAFGGCLPIVLPLERDMIAQLRDELFRGKNRTLARPRKKAFRHFTNREVAFSLPCNGLGTLTFGPCQVDWCSIQGNNAWVHAKEGLTWHVFQAALDAYSWKQGEGGQFICDSEINRTDHGEPLRQTIGRR
jgi:hypothetical protein